MQGHAEVVGGLEVAEEIGAQGHHHLEAGAAAEGGAEDGAAEPHLVGVANGEELFALIDADQDLGLGALMGVAELGGELGQGGGQAAVGVGLLQTLIE